MVALAFNPSTREAEAGDFWVRGQPGLQSEFQDSQDYTEKPCLKKTKNKKQKNKKQKTNKKTNKTKQRTLTALPEVLSSIPSNHMVAHNHP